MFWHIQMSPQSKSCANRFFETPNLNYQFTKIIEHFKLKLFILMEEIHTRKCNSNDYSSYIMPPSLNGDIFIGKPCILYEDYAHLIDHNTWLGHE